MSPRRHEEETFETYHRVDRPNVGPTQEASCSRIAANHLSFIDSPLLMFGLDRQVSMLGKAEYLDGRVTSWLFPEGTRSRGRGLRRGRAGVAHLALRTEAPIVPVGIIGTDAVQAPGDRAPKLRGRVDLRFGSPIDLGPWAMAPPTAEVKAEITATVMTSIAALSGQEFRDEFAPPPAAATQ